MYQDNEYTPEGFENQEGSNSGETIDHQDTEETAAESDIMFTAQVEVNEARERAEAMEAEKAAQEKEAQEKAAQAAETADGFSEEAGQQAYETDAADSTYRYTNIPYNREVIGGAGNTGGSAQGSADTARSAASSEEAASDGDIVDADVPDPEETKHAGRSNTTYSTAGEGPQYAKPEKKKKKAKKKKPSTGARVLKFIGKCVAAALIFGLVASLTFNGVNSLLGSSDSSSSSASDVSEALVSSASGDASSSSVSVGTATALDVSDVVDEVMPAIVAVTSVYSYTDSYSFGMGSDTSSTYTSAGSGIIVAQTDETLYIATNNHVVEDSDSVSVTFVDDSEVAAEIKGTDSTNDLAVLSVSISDMSAETLSSITVATLGDSDSIEVGETTIAIGNALGYGQSVTTGIVSALNREVTIDSVTSLLIQTDAAINPGNSGGALLNAAGEVIGINSAKYADTDVEGMGYAIPINTAIPIINELIEQEKVSDSEASYLGIYGVDVTDEVSEYYAMPTGVYISQVESGSAAEAAGIQAGDILTSFDGKTIASMEALQSLMQYYAGGTTVEVIVQRANNGTYESVTLSVTLGYKNQ